MLIEVKRKVFTEKSTIGDLFINGQWHCYTLEDCYREGEKIPGETAIPQGLYPVIVNLSPRLGRLMPRLLNVPNFEGILIHKGNTDEDTKGCILVGAHHGEDRIWECGQVFQDLFDQIVLATNTGEKTIAIVSNEEGDLHAEA